MKKLISILMSLCLVFTIAGANYSIAMAEENVVALDLSTAVYKASGTGEISNGNRGLGVYDSLTFENLDQSVKAIKVTGSYDRYFSWNAVTIQLTFDDNSKFTFSQYQSNEWTDIPVSEGRFVKTISVSHGLSGVVYNLESFEIKLHDEVPYTMEDSVNISSGKMDPKVGMLNDLIILPNDTYSVISYTVGKAIDTFKLTSNFIYEHNSTSINMMKSTATVRFYGEDGQYFKTSIELDKDVRTINVAVPAELKGKIISKFTIGEAPLWMAIRNIELKTMEVDTVKSLKANVSSIYLSSVSGKNASQLKITATYKSGKVVDVSKKAVYKSSVPTKISVSSTGKIVVKSGTKRATRATVTASFGGKEVKIIVTVK